VWLGEQTARTRVPASAGPLEAYIDQ